MTVEGGAEAEVSLVVVLRSQWGAAYGAEILVALRTYLVDSGATLVRAHIRNRNEAAMTIADRAGFVVSGGTDGQGMETWTYNA